jgi:DNA-binding beta-propeller fold protein YncE
MAQNYSCRNGHQWDPAANSRAQTSQWPILCPQCGAEGELVADDPATIPPRQALSSGKPPPFDGIVDAVPADFPLVPGYEVLSVLGRGGMGVVYRARDLELKRVVALKMIRDATLAGPDDLARFRTEAKAVARLQHPNIVQIHEVGEADGYPYFSLEYVSGGSLAKKLKGGVVSPRRAGKMLETLALAMHHAHRRNIIHRDLKPANVLLTSDGVPKVTDFGLAKRLDESMGQTQSNAILGTPSYMAPEQAGGKVKEVGRSADIYALGAILYEMLTGQPPFQAATQVDTLLKVITEPPVPPSRLEPEVSRDLETICLKCLEKEPRNRYPTARALAEDLRRFLDDEPIHARPLGIVGQAGRWIRHHPFGAVLTVLIVVGVLAGACMNLLTLRWLGGGMTVPPEYRPPVQPPAGPAGAKSGPKPAAPQPRDTISAKITLDGRIGPLGSVCLSPDGKLIAAAGAKNTIQVWDTTTHEIVQTFPGDNTPGRSISFSPDGKRLAAAGVKNTVKVWDVKTGNLIHQLEGHTQPVNGVAFSPREKRLASAGADGTILVWDAAGGKKLFSLTGHRAAVNGVAFSADGKRLASASVDTTISIWDLDTAKEILPPLKGHKESVTVVAFSPDGKRLASTATDLTVKVWDVAGARQLLSFYGYSGTSLAFSPDGKQIAAASVPSGQFVAGFKGRPGLSDIKVFDATSDRTFFLLHGHASEVAGVAFHPDGKRLVSASSDGTLKLWSIPDLFATAAPAK